MTINAGIRFDHSRAISQDLPGFDLDGRETGRIFGPGHALHLELVVATRGRDRRLERRRPNDAAGELRKVQPGHVDRRTQAIHPGAAVTTIRAGDRRIHELVVTPGGPASSIPTSGLRTPIAYSIGVDREIGRGSPWRPPTSGRMAGISSDGTTSAVYREKTAVS